MSKHLLRIGIILNKNNQVFVGGTMGRQGVDDGEDFIGYEKNC